MKQLQILYLILITFTLIGLSISTENDTSTDQMQDEKNESQIQQIFTCFVLSNQKLVQDMVKIEKISEKNPQVEKSMLLLNVQLDLIKFCYPLISADNIELILSENQQNVSFDDILKRPFDYRKYDVKDYNYTLRDTDRKILGLITALEKKIGERKDSKSIKIFGFDLENFKYLSIPIMLGLGYLIGLLWKKAVAGMTENPLMKKDQKKQKKQ